jgi:3-dehydroquinate dehydratase-2
LAIDFRQSNHEGELVGWVQEAKGRAAGIIVNAAGYTTTSIALLDALLALGLPVIEVHLSNIFRRESFRQHSLMSLAAKGVICGLGASGYLLAIDAFARLLRTEEEA